MTPRLRAKIFNVIDWLVENEAVCLDAWYEGESRVDIPADKIDEAVEKIIELMKQDLDRDKEECEGTRRKIFKAPPNRL